MTQHTNPQQVPDPVVGGAWERTVDGALLPADQATAERAGLPWPPVVSTPTEKE